MYASGPLERLMAEMLRQLRVEIDRNDASNESDHHKICCEMADRFKLWERWDEGSGEGDCFPIWLSRIVNGEQLDYTNGEGHWYKEGE